MVGGGGRGQERAAGAGAEQLFEELLSMLSGLLVLRLTRVRCTVWGRLACFWDTGVLAIPFLFFFLLLGCIFRGRLFVLFVELYVEAADCLYQGFFFFFVGMVIMLGCVKLLDARCGWEYIHYVLLNARLCYDFPRSSCVL